MNFPLCLIQGLVWVTLLPWQTYAHDSGLDHDHDLRVISAEVQIEKQLPIVTGNSQICWSGQTTPQGQREIRSSDICTALDLLPPKPGQLLAAEGGPELKLCQIVWQSKLATSQRNRLDACGAKEDRFTQQYVPPTHQQMLEKYIYVPAQPTPSDAAGNGRRQQMFATYTAIRERMATECCTETAMGKAADTCTKAMQRVNLLICQPPEDPAKENLCGIGSGYFVPYSDSATIYRDLLRKYANEPQKRDLFLATLKRQHDTADNLLKNRDQLKPFSGSIETTPYLWKDTEGNPIWSEFRGTMVHELGHACSYIKAQLTAYQKENRTAGDNAAFYLLDKYSPKRICRASESTRRHYEDLYQGLAENTQVSACLNRITQLQTLKAALPPCQAFCEGIGLDETYAMATEISSLQNDITEIYPYSCTGMRDSQHPAKVDIMECFAAYSPQFRHRMKHQFCGEK